MKTETKSSQKSKRGFLKLSVASCLLTVGTILSNKSSYANDKSDANKIKGETKTLKKVVLELKVDKDKVKPFMVFLNNNLENVRNFDGCSQVEVYYNHEEYNMIIDEVWESIEHHQKYLDFITKNGVMAELGSFLALKPDIKYFDFVDL